MVQDLIFRLEHVLSCAAFRANPILGKIFKSGAGGYVGHIVAHCRVIDISTQGAYIFGHGIYLTFIYYVYIMIYNLEKIKGKGRIDGGSIVV